MKPLGERVILKLAVPDVRTAGGIYLPATSQEKITEGIITAVGTLTEDIVKVGDKVVYDKYAGTQIVIDNLEYLIININDILAIC